MITLNIFSRAVVIVSCSLVSNSVTPWTAACQSLCPWEFQARTLEWVAVSSSRDLPDPGRIGSLSPALQVDSLPLSHLGNPFSRAPVDLQRRRQWHPTPVLLPGKSHGRRSLVGCSPWGREESDMTKRIHFHFSFSCIGEGNGNPRQCSFPENPRDGGAWWAAVYGVA